MRNVIIDGVIDTSPEGHHQFGCILLGDSGFHGENFEDSMKYVTVPNVISSAQITVDVSGFLADSVITDVINRNKNGKTIDDKHKNGLKNVLISNTEEAK
jgi:hypothetical protein